MSAVAADAGLRAAMLDFEGLMREAGDPVEIHARHIFAKGLYARQILIPAGTLLSGKIHKTEHLNIISMGEITVLTEQGPMRIQAPCTLVSPAGTKRIGLAHTDTVWTTIHATEETDLEALEDQLIAADYDEFERLAAPQGQLSQEVVP